MRIVLVLLALLNVAWGLFALARPGAAGRFVGLSIDAAHGAGELRAVYGALVIAFGVVIAASLRLDGGDQWLRLLAILFAGLAAGRVISLALDGVVGYTLAALLLEAGTAALLYYGARSVGP